MQIHFHNHLCSYIPKVPIFLAMTVSVHVNKLCLGYLVNSSTTNALLNHVNPTPFSCI